MEKNGGLEGIEKSIVLQGYVGPFLKQIGGPVQLGPLLQLFKKEGRLEDIRKKVNQARSASPLLKVLDTNASIQELTRLVEIHGTRTLKEIVSQHGAVQHALQGVGRLAAIGEVVENAELARSLLQNHGGREGLGSLVGLKDPGHLKELVDVSNMFENVERHKVWVLIVNKLLQDGGRVSQIRQGRKGHNQAKKDLKQVRTHP